MIYLRFFASLPFLIKSRSRFEIRFHFWSNVDEPGSVLHAGTQTDAGPGELVNDALVDSLLAGVQLGVEQALLIWTMLALIREVTSEHEKKVVSQDLRSSPGVLQETLVDDNSIAATVRNLAHAAIGHPSKLMTSCSCLAVLTELVEQQKDDRIAILLSNRENIVTDCVALLFWSHSFCPHIGTLPNQPQIVEPDHLVCLIRHLVDVSFNSIITTIRPVRVASDMACEDVLSKEVAEVNVACTIAICCHSVDEWNIPRNSSACQIWESTVLVSQINGRHYSWGRSLQ